MNSDLEARMRSLYYSRYNKLLAQYWLSQLGEQRKF